MPALINIRIFANDKPSYFSHPICKIFEECPCIPPHLAPVKNALKHSFDTNASFFFGAEMANKVQTLTIFAIGENVSV